MAPRPCTKFFFLSCLFLLTYSAPLCAQSELLIDQTIIVEGTPEWDWTQVRTSRIPGSDSFSLSTLSRTAKVGAHGYHDVYLTMSKDDGKTWSPPVSIPTLRREKHNDGYEIVAGDLWPKCHAHSGKVLITGKTFNFAEGTRENILREQISYAVLDPHTLRCGPLQTLKMPERDHSNNSTFAPNAGCHQRVDLPNGEILLPVRYQRQAKPRIYTSTVVRCRFDGEHLTYIEHGSEHSIPTGRGLYEPSLIHFNGKYFLTLRADDSAYVALSSDGLNYSEPIPWKFDNQELLGSYNTQQHWVVLNNKLYLVYTRKGANNDHIMRHRAPLFLAEVDPENLHVIRKSEQVLVPENHATLGNSGVCLVNPNEAWVTVAEGNVSGGKRRGENNKVFLIKIKSD